MRADDITAGSEPPRGGSVHNTVIATGGARRLGQLGVLRALV